MDGWIPTENRSGDHFFCDPLVMTSPIKVRMFLFFIDLIGSLSKI